MPLSRSRERLLRRISTRTGREAEGVVLLEGPRVLATAMRCGADLAFVVLEEGWLSTECPGLVDQLGRSGVELMSVPGAALREMASTENPQGILGVARQPRPTLPRGSACASLRCLVLDAVQDPGNVGSLVRSAAALGVEMVLALDGTADPWGSKAVRASAGLAFALPVHSLPWEGAASWLKEAGLPLLIADPRGEEVRGWLDVDPSSARSGWALLVGNEGRGPRPEATATAHARLAIPTSAGVDSLNVATAGAILLWTLGSVRRTREKAGVAP